MRRARRSGSTFGCACLLARSRSRKPPSFFLVDVGILCQVHKLEVHGRKVKMSIWVRCCVFFCLHHVQPPDAETLFFALSLVPYIYIFVGHGRSRTFPNHHRIVLPWSAGRHTRYEYSPRCVSPLGGSQGFFLSSLATHALPNVCDAY